VALGFQDQLMRLMTRPYRLAVADLGKSMREEYRKEPHAPVESLDDAMIDEFEKAKALPPDALARLRAAQQREHERALDRAAPSLPDDLQAVSLGETFGAYMQICTLAAALVSAPILLHQLWAFIAAGLYDHEKRTVRRVLPWSLALFFLGLAFGFAVLANMSVEFLLSYGDLTLVRPQPAVGAYLGLLFLLLLVMGLVFQIPLVMTVLASIGLVSPKWFRSKRRHCILAIAVIAAVITPPDYVSMLLVLGPMLLLFEMGLYLATGAARRREARLAAAQDAKT
jgi:sec-independent protein translocase protein TatC